MHGLGNTLCDKGYPCLVGALAGPERGTGVTERTPQPHARIGTCRGRPRKVKEAMH
jgi:hypothetical protein